MNRQAIQIVLNYIEEQACPAQITYDGKRNYMVDFQSRIHAEVCHAELKDARFDDTQTLLTGHHARVE